MATNPNTNTTSEDHDSTSLDETARSLPVSPNLELGREIVRALGDDERSGVLERWIAHHIAGLMTQAETADPGPARDAAEAACRKAILDVWERRRSWPHGSLLGDLLCKLRALETPPDWVRFRSPNAGLHPNWLTLHRLFSSIAVDEHQIAFNAEIASVGLDLMEAQSVAEESSEDLSEDERETFKYLRNLQERARQPGFKLGEVEAANFRELSPDDQIKIVRRAFEASNQRRLEAVDRVAEIIRASKAGDQPS